jgi:peptidoglycan/LPS O-acetylase OafA/YrhL
MHFAMNTVVSKLRDNAHSGRISELDALRGLAAMAVVIFHYTCGITRLTKGDRIYFEGFWVGQYGVHLFFAISGFVICMTLERTRRGSDFLVSRFSRLIPVYYFGLCMTALVLGMSGAPQDFLHPLPWTDIALNFTMLTHLLGAKPVDPSYWTLQIELLFYVIMWAVWAANGLRQIERVMFIWVGLAMLFGMGFVSPLIGSLLILNHIPLFAIGIIAYRITQDGWRPSLHAPRLGWCLFAVQLQGDPLVMLAAIAVTGIMMMLAQGRLALLRHPLLLWLGAISYPLYIIHQYIGISIIFRFDAMGLARPVSVLLTLTMMLALAEAIRRSVEQPALRFIRDRWRLHGRDTKSEQVLAA